MLKPLPIPLEKSSISGPWMSNDACAAIGGGAVLLELAKNRQILWAAHDKGTYYALRQVDAGYSKGVPWIYPQADALLESVARCGRVTVHHIGDLWIVRDGFSKEMYLFFDRRSAMEAAVAISYYFPDSRMIPEADGLRVFVPETPEAQSALGAISDIGVQGWGRDLVELTTRPVPMHLSDAISILNGDNVSTQMRANIAAAFPHALLSMGLPAVIILDPQTSSLVVGRCLSDVYTPDGPLQIPPELVGGWAYALYRTATSPELLAMRDLRVSLCSSPSDYHKSDLNYWP